MQHPIQPSVPVLKPPEPIEETKEIDLTKNSFKVIGILGQHHKEAKNWKQKLELVQNILNTVELKNNELAAVGGYLQLINNGQILCEEDGATL